MNGIKVKGHGNLVRDPHSKAIINTDSKALSEYQDKKIIYEKIKEVDSLKQEISDIKGLLNAILQKL